MPTTQRPRTRRPTRFGVSPSFLFGESDSNDSNTLKSPTGSKHGSCGRRKRYGIDPKVLKSWSNSNSNAPNKPRGKQPANPQRWLPPRLALLLGVGGLLALGGTKGWYMPRPPPAASDGYPRPRGHTTDRMHWENGRRRQEKQHQQEQERQRLKEAQEAQEKARRQRQERQRREDERRRQKWKQAVDADPHWKTALGWQPGNTLKTLQRKYRRLSALLHPDKGGSQALFVSLDSAWGRARAAYRK